MSNKMKSLSGIVRECAVIPRTANGQTRDYVLMTVATKGELHQFVSSAKYFGRLAENYGITTPEVDTKSEPVTDIIGKAVEIQYETAIEGRTTYTDSKGKEQTHKSSGNNLRKLFVLSDNSTESAAYRNQHLESQGVSNFAISEAAKQSAELMKGAFDIIKQTKLPETQVQHLQERAETPTDETVPEESSTPEEQ